jgi:gamma-glutamylcyclotransferase (GGCT)/AIG2-like uncharacterized protein YtfP
VIDDLPLFVYGTLMSGQAQAGLLGRLSRRKAVISGRLFHLSAGYPAVTLDGRDEVHGELVGPLDARTLRLLDHYEGLDDGVYRRVVVQARIGLRPHQAWAYVMSDPLQHGGRYLPTGRWQGQRTWT